MYLLETTIPMVGRTTPSAFKLTGYATWLLCLQAHAYGIVWFQQKRDASGKISFLKHMIGDLAGGVSFSEPHGTSFAEVDGNGITDFIVEKRFWSHRGRLPRPRSVRPAGALCVQTVRNNRASAGAEFVPELINNRSGTGSDVLSVDLHKDGAMDIVTATGFGTFIFWGKPRSGVKKVGL
jgi:hypothetical protein